MHAWAGPYVGLLADARVARLAAAAAISRLTTSMLSLSLLLAVADVYGSYAQAGAALFVHAVGLAIAAPLAGRLVDKVGVRRTLVSFIALHGFAYAGLAAALTLELATGLVFVLAGLLGSSTPPGGAVVRGSWPLLVADRNLSTAYALDTAIDSGTFVLGPLVAGALMLIAPASAAVALGAATKLVGDTLIAIGAPDRALAAGQARRHSILGPLADRQLALLFAIIALDTFVIGNLQVGAVSFATVELAGLLFSVFACGEVAGGLLYGVRSWRGSLRDHLIVLHLATAGATAAMAGLQQAALLIIAYLCAGILGGARDAIGQLAVGRTAAEGYRTEAFSWLTSFMWAGYGLGTLSAGWVAADFGRDAIYAMAAMASLAAASVALIWRSGRPSQ